MSHLLIITNLLTPYTRPVYKELAERVGNLSVLLTGQEDNRNWCLDDSNGVAAEQVSGVVIKQRANPASVESDVRYLHIPFNLLSRLFQLKPDVIVSGEMGARTLAAWLYCKLRRKPLVVVWEGTTHSQKSTAFAKRMLRKLFFRHLPSSWIAIGSESEDYLASLGVDRSRIVRSAYAVDTSVYTAAPSEVMNSYGPGPILLTVGQYIRRKGLRELLQAVSVLQKRGRVFTTVLVGGGPEQPILEKMASDLRLENVVFLPFVAPEELPAIYTSADVHVFPSLSDGWGQVVVEAVACGTPVLSSIYAGATADMVPEEWRFDPLNEDEFVESLEMAMAKSSGAVKEFSATACLPDVESVAGDYIDAISMTTPRPIQFKCRENK